MDTIYQLSVPKSLIGLGKRLFYEREMLKGQDMKSLESVVILSVLFIFLFVSPVFGDNWVQYGTTNEGNVFSYKKDTVKWKNKNIVQVWERLDFSVEGRDDFIQYRLDNGLPIWDKLSFLISLDEYDCKEIKSKDLYFTYYDTDGKVLDSVSSNDWEHIIPGSIRERLYKIVCKKPK